MVNLLLPLLVFSTIFERLNIFVPSLDFSLKLSLIILPIAGLVLLLKKRLAFNPTFLFPALAAAVLTEILSIIFSFDRFQSFQVVVFHLLMIGLFYLIVWSVRSERGLDRLVWAWGIGAGTVSLLGIWQFFRYAWGADPTLFFERWFSAKTLPVDTFIQSLYGLLSWQTRHSLGMIDHFLRPPSTFIDVSTGASFVGVFLILGLGWFLSWKREDRRRMLMGALMIIASLYFLVAVSRSAALGLVAGLGVFSYLYFKDRINTKILKPLIITGALAILGAGIVFSITTQRLESTFNRLTYAQDAWQMFIKNPLLGVGVGNFEPYCRSVLDPGSPACYAHSIFLTWIGEMGILGLAANLFLIVTLIVFMSRIFKKTIRDSAWRWKISGLLGGVTALVFANIFHAHYGLEFTWVLIGLAVAGYYSARVEYEKANPKGLKSSTLRVDVLGVKIDNVTMEEVLGRVNDLFRSKEIGKNYIVTPNPEMLILARHDESFRRILNGASLAVSDGVGLVWGSRILGTPLAARVTGTDLFFELCAQTARRGGRVFFLEGPEGLRSSAKAAQVLKEKFPKLNVGTLIVDDSQDNDAKTVKLINQSTPQPIDLLFVSYGHGNQERWIKRNLSKLNVKVAMGVGGAFDFIAGVQVRAPMAIRSLGLEWFYRLIRQHKGRRINRLKRQVFALIPFIFLIFKESWKN